MRNFMRPKIILSACLNLEPVRYDGGFVKDEFVLKLRDFCDINTVCPEVSIGLGVPREKIIVYKTEEGYRISQPSTGSDLTDIMYKFSEDFISNLSNYEFDGAILKSKSPSCGVSNTLVYKDKEGKIYHSKGKGIFAMLLMEKFPLIPIEDEGRLKNPDIKRNFLTRIFSLADLREFRKNAKEVKEIMDFHQRYKYLLMTYSQEKLRKLGKIVANINRDNFKESLSIYSEIFLKALSKKPSRNQHYNTLSHIFGHISEKLREKEKMHFLNLLKNYKEGKVELKVILEILKNWVFRFDDEYLITQAYLIPYPEELE
ncbi:MAG: hypothetical protein CBR30_00325 [Dictyoglomus sp. NZ13-RE01]|nr:MAG: hypothetical protein CBR30_00325 [Dictyoglomus sp. NZ13-RE01]